MRTNFRLPGWLRLLVPITLLPLSLSPVFAQSNSIAEVQRQFASPPDESRIMMRWWWFGSAVKKAELERELKTMKAAGIGGVEIQPVYPMALDDPARDIKNFPYLSPDFIDAVQFASGVAHDLGMRVDATLGSGWPYGGPHTAVTQAASKLRVERLNVPDGGRSIALPAIGEGESLIGAFLGGQQVKKITNGRIEIPPGLSGIDLLQVFIASRTGQQVKRPAVGAEGFVLDHYDKAAIENHLSAVGDVLLQAFGSRRPYAVFSDSLEVYESDWTAKLLDEFRTRRGYDLAPHLPALVNDSGRETQAIRHDWGKTLTELAEDNYLKPIHEWAEAHQILFRSQTYGGPPVILSSNALVDLPEGEHGPSWRRFSAARWASSASHLYNKPVTSTETWTWLHSPAFRATPLDMKAEADRHFLEGVNQLIGHGWPYSPAVAGEPGWAFYAAAAFNDHNPWFRVMPDIARYLQRISFLLRQGSPANDVAIYVPTDDAWARLRPGKVAVDETVDSLLGPVLIPEVLNAGYNFDFIDDRAIAAVGITHKLLILPGVERIPLATLQRLGQFVEKGGMLIATRGLPSLGTGLREAETETEQIKQAAQQLFANARRTRLVGEDQNLAKALTELLHPDFAVNNDASAALGFIHRKLADAEIYFVANSSNRSVETVARFRVNGLQAQLWNPFSGEFTPASAEAGNGTETLKLTLAPYESCVVVFTKTSGQISAAEARSNANSATMDFSSGWKISFASPVPAVEMGHLHSWSDDERTRFYSGEATYEKNVNLPPTFFLPQSRFVLDFGPGSPIEPSPGEALGMRALLENPIHESAVVFVNGQRSGFVWHPPYELDITRYLRAGNNFLRIVVGNSAINELAGRTLPDYRLLNLRYGERFVPQDVKDMRPLPSGITGPIRIVRREGP